MATQLVILSIDLESAHPILFLGSLKDGDPAPMALTSLHIPRGIAEQLQVAKDCLPKDDPPPPIPIPLTEKPVE